MSCALSRLPAQNRCLVSSKGQIRYWLRVYDSEASIAFFLCHFRPARPTANPYACPPSVPSSRSPPSHVVVVTLPAWRASRFRQDGGDSDDGGDYVPKPGTQDLARVGAPARASGTLAERDRLMGIAGYPGWQPAQ